LISAVASPGWFSSNPPLQSMDVGCHSWFSQWKHQWWKLKKRKIGSEKFLKGVWYFSYCLLLLLFFLDESYL
jgi:hypothetical protein